MRKFAVIFSVVAAAISIIFSVNTLNAAETKSGADASKKEDSGKMMSMSAADNGGQPSMPASSMSPKTPQPNIGIPQIPEIPRIVFLKPGERVVGPDGRPVGEGPVQVPVQKENAAVDVKDKKLKGKTNDLKSAAPGKADNVTEETSNVTTRFEMFAGELVSTDSKDPANVIIKIKTADGKEVEAVVEPYVTVMKMYNVTELPKGEVLTLHCMTDDSNKTLRAVSISSGKMEMPNITPPSEEMLKDMPTEDTASGKK